MCTCRGIEEESDVCNIYIYIDTRVCVYKYVYLCIHILLREGGSHDRDHQFSDHGDLDIGGHLSQLLNQDARIVVNLDRLDDLVWRGLPFEQSHLLAFHCFL